MLNEVLILSAVRTPIGSLGGALASVPAPKLASLCIRSALDKAQVSSDDVDEVIMGNVIGAGMGQNPARQAALGAELPPSVGAMTVNKVCGSGLKSIMLGTQSIRLGHTGLVVAGGMESMSQAPYLLPGARKGYRMGNGTLVDSLLCDGLWDIYTDRHMGEHGDRCAQECGFTRDDQDNFAVRSYTRAQRAIADGVFDKETVAVEVKVKKSTHTVTEDEEPSRFNEDKLRSLRPAFGKEGTVTAGNAPSVNDGAAAVVIASDRKCESLLAKPLARIVGAASFSREPEWFTLAPIGAMKKLLDKINWSVEDIDLFEVNEAFSVVAMAAAKELKIPDEKLNPFGGAVALGHPIGCSGARILVTLLNGLQQTGGRRGVAALCIGGGEAVAMAVERIED